jgi:SAM-dependent MidA family methyltransferase
MRQRPPPENELTRLIRREIEATGSMSFARFMDFALYHPIHGYYERSAKQIGCQGDFYTSVSVGPLFGELLAFQFSEWLEEAASASQKAVPLQVIEAGAHDGQLASDILSWIKRQRPALWPLLDYWILEPSNQRRHLQEQQLQSHGSKVRWAARWEEFPYHARGVIFSNELLDAFPFVRLGWDSTRRSWFEWRVDWAEGRFAWRRGTASMEVQELLEKASWLELSDQLQAVLPDGFTIELSPQAEKWWAQAAATLRHGKLLTCDYGLEAIEIFEPHRRNGTLRTYREHRPGSDALDDIGEQDITAHVNFTALETAGAKSGLHTEFFGGQSQFLTRTANKVFQDQSRFGPWRQAATRQFQTLIHPAHLGRAFRLLIQART